VGFTVICAFLCSFGDFCYFAVFVVGWLLFWVFGDFRNYWCFGVGIILFSVCFCGTVVYNRCVVGFSGL